MDDHIFITQENIKISYCRYGVETGHPAFYFHGLPGSRAEAQFLNQPCIDNNINLIAPERFGYGKTPPAKGNRYLNWVKCIEQLADELNVKPVKIEFVCELFDTFHPI